MKFHIEVECPPEELRRLLGLPEVADMQEKLLKEIQAKLTQAIQESNPEKLLKSWMGGMSENWQEWQAALRWSDYRVFQEQKMPFQVEVLRRDKAGEVFVQADLQVTDVVQKGKYAWW